MMLAVWREPGGAHHKGLFSACRHLHGCVGAADTAWREMGVFPLLTTWFLEKAKADYLREQMEAAHLKREETWLQDNNNLPLSVRPIIIPCQGLGTEMY